MSFPALAWAAAIKVRRSTDKLVLLGLAECADRHTCEAFPSIAALVEFGSLDRKTVMAALDRLEGIGLIAATGEMRGRTRQIKVYRLAVGTVPKTEQSQKRNSPDIPREQSQKRDTEPVREPVPKKATPSRVKRATGYPANFHPVMTGKTASTVDGWPPGRLDDELEHFADHHVAKGTTSYDWQASWRTWVKNSKRWEPRNGNITARSGPRPDGFIAALREARSSDHAANF